MRHWSISMKNSMPAAAEALAALAAALLLGATPAAAATGGQDAAETRSGADRDPAAIDDEAPPMALLAYLGSWDAADAGWLELLADATDEADADDGEQDDE